MKPLLPFSIFILTIISCSDMIEYSPYDTDVPDIDYNTSQILAMNDHLKSEDTLSFALISDSHTSYDELEKMIKVINKIEGLTFIANCGDLTDAGLADEFERYHKIISKSGYPVVSLIGNHDHRSNGAQIYQKIFGQPNQSFVSGDYKFVLFDNVIWENNNLSPKYDWLINQLADTNHTNILLTHIPPWSDQFEGLNNLVYKQIVAPQNTLLCLHGHLHHHTDTTYNGIRTIVSGSVDEAGYSIVKLFNKQVFINYYPNK